MTVIYSRDFNPERNKGNSGTNGGKLGDEKTKDAEIGEKKNEEIIIKKKAKYQTKGARGSKRQQTWEQNRGLTPIRLVLLPLSLANKRKTKMK